MENAPRVLTVSYNDVDSNLPFVKTIKCEESDGFIETTRIDHHTMSYLETTLNEDDIPAGDFTDRRRFLSLENELQFISVKNMVGIFKCFRCGFSCTSTKDLIRHYQQYRKQEPYTCFQCGYIGSDKLDFVEHSRGHFENVYYRCSKCLFRADTTNEIRRHVQDHSHEPSVKVDKFKCPLCDVNLASKLSFKSHLNSCQALLKDISSSRSGGGLVQKKESQPEHKPVPENTQKVVIKEELDEENANPVYTCPHCFFIFSSKYKRSMHIYKIHLKNKKDSEHFKIENDDDEVDEKTADGSAREIKVGSDMNPSVQLERIYLCPVCHYVFTSISSLNSHVITHKSVTECPVCKLDCKTNYDLKEHMTSHASKKSTSEFSCSVCDKKFVTLGKLKYHIKEEHMEGFKCPYCPRFVKSESALKIHIEAHSKIKEYYCRKCKFTAKNSALLQFHMSKFHPNKKKFICDVCEKAYMYKYSLQRHKLNCPGLESKGYKEGETSAPEIEIDISQKEKLNCSECKANFKEAAHLKRHLLVHFHKTPYRCMKCGLRCKAKHILSAHMKIHNIKAHYQCKVCLQKFKTRHALNNHAVMHSEKRPYTCEVCGQTFKRKANYRRHYDIHSDIKPFRCPMCDFTTKRKDGLYKHLETHKKGEGIAICVDGGETMPAADKKRPTKTIDAIVHSAF